MSLKQMITPHRLALLLGKLDCRWKHQIQKPYREQTLRYITREIVVFDNIFDAPRPPKVKRNVARVTVSLISNDVSATGLPEKLPSSHYVEPDNQTERISL